jgi:hypothetical protein
MQISTREKKASFSRNQGESLVYLVKMINKDSGIRSNEARTVESETGWKMDVAYI